MSDMHDDDIAAIAKAVERLLPLRSGISQTLLVPLALGCIASVRVTIVDGSAKDADLPQAVGTPADVQIQATGKGKTYKGGAGQ